MNLSLYIPSAILDNVTLNLIKAHSQIPLFLISGASAYYFISKAIDKKGMIIANASWNVSSTILAVITGYLIWDERLNNKKIIGLGMAIPALYLMNDA